MNNSKRLIFLSGSHRSGTTWAAKIIAASNSVGYIMEPFNDANNRPGIFTIKFGHYYPYISGNRDPQLHQAIKETINYKFDFIKGLNSIKSGYQFLRLVKDISASSWYRISKKRPFIKDPNALFMAEWIHKNFDSDIIILIRHPAAFVSSLILLNWYFPFSDILKQESLISTHLEPFELEIEKFSRKKNSLIDEAILAWRIIHHIIINYQRLYKTWIFIRHEDLSRDSEIEFKKIFSRINLKFNGKVKHKLYELSGLQNPIDTTNKTIPLSSKKSIQRNSNKNIWNWKNRLSQKQIKYIRNCVEDISSYFYTDKDW